jgi:hypothetical protein
MENIEPNQRDGSPPHLVLGPGEILTDIATPKGKFEGAFFKTTTIAEVIKLVVEDKKLDKKDTFELVHKETVLQPEDRTLESFGFHHGEVKLELVAKGSGV